MLGYEKRISNKQSLYSISLHFTHCSIIIIILFVVGRSSVKRKLPQARPRIPTLASNARKNHSPLTQL